MRVLYFDIDTTRADHLGCYGYHRNTSPNIDRIAQKGTRFENCYVSDAPCLPSRAAMFTGKFGIHTGVVNHGGQCADLRPIVERRDFNIRGDDAGFVEKLRALGMRTVSISPFADRHAAWWFYAGFNEMLNTGKAGGESSEEIVPHAIEWLKQNGKDDNWLLHVNVWDPHTPYRAPAEFGNPFEDEPIDAWYDEELRERQWNDWGVAGPREPAGGLGRSPDYPRQPAHINNMADYKAYIDGYDCGIRYADEWFGRLMNTLADLGILDDTVIMITSDHGENFGELGVIADHQTADQCTSRVPMILRFPGLGVGRLDRGLYNQCDFSATLVELLGGKASPKWDAISFADSFNRDKDGGRPYVVFSQCAWSCVRSVRWDQWIASRVYHTGLKNWPSRMLFDIVNDPHEQANIAEAMNEKMNEGLALLDSWHVQQMAKADGPDPLWQVMQEGGPHHTRGEDVSYWIDHLRQTGRNDGANLLAANPTGVEGIK